MKCTAKLLALFIMLLIWVQMLAIERSKKSWRRKVKKYKRKYRKLRTVRKIGRGKLTELKMHLKGK